MDFSLQRLTLLCITFILSGTLGGCDATRYYLQSISGQLQIMLKQQSIEQLLTHNHLDESTRQQLQTVLDVLEFSITVMQLPDNGSYRHYADLKRDYVVWNVFATPAYSLEPLQWCYLIIGCLSYRGYFNHDEAFQLQQQLKKANHDVYVGGVTAYSTLGWFADQVLNTMIKSDIFTLASILFHELAHQQIYVNGDTTFNESYAKAVAAIALEKWLTRQPYLLAEAKQATYQKKAIIKLIMDYRNRLQQLYQGDHGPQEMALDKQKLYASLKDDYRDLSRNWSSRDYDQWFTKDLNNAKLSTLITYTDYQDDIYQMYEATGRNLSLFYDIIRKLSKCMTEERHRLLKKRDTAFKCD